MYFEKSKCFATRGARVNPNGGFGCAYEFTTSNGHSSTLMVVRPTHKQLILNANGRGRGIPTGGMTPIAIISHAEHQTWRITISYDDMPLCA